MEYGKSFGQWIREVEHCIVRRGYSEQYANAIAICVRGYYTGSHAYMNPQAAAIRGLSPHITIAAH